MIEVGVWLLVGSLIGAIHARLLFRAVAALVQTPRIPALALGQAARFGFVIAALWVAAQAGAVALVSAAAGFTLAQIAAGRIVGRP